MTGDSYSVNETKTSVSETTSTLIIQNVNRHRQQMGRYECVAKNSLGKDEKFVNVYSKLLHFTAYNFGQSSLLVTLV